MMTSRGSYFLFSAEFVGAFREFHFVSDVLDVKETRGAIAFYFWQPFGFMKTFNFGFSSRRRSLIYWFVVAETSVVDPRLFFRLLVDSKWRRSNSFKMKTK